MAKYRPYRFPLYLLARAAAAFVSFLPRRAALALARVLGRAAYNLIPRQRNLALNHLRLAFGESKPESEIQGIARSVFSHGAQTLVDILQFSKFKKSNLDSIVEAKEAFRLYRSLLGEGKGVISITAHMGNWELLAGTFGLSGFDGAVIGRKIYYEPYNRWIVNLRLAVGVRTIYREDAARGVLSVLRRNQIIGMLPDQDIASQEGIFLPFFGRPAYTPAAPVKLALVTGAPIVPSFLIREPEGRYRILLGEVIRPNQEIAREEAIRRSTEDWMGQFEDMIRRFPDQWMWMHNRWKTQPEASFGAKKEILIHS